MRSKRLLLTIMEILVQGRKNYGSSRLKAEGSDEGNTYGWLVGWLEGNYEKMDPIENQPA